MFELGLVRGVRSRLGTRAGCNGDVFGYPSVAYDEPNLGMLVLVFTGCRGSTLEILVLMFIDRSVLAYWDLN